MAVVKEQNRRLPGAAGGRMGLLDQSVRFLNKEGRVALWALAWQAMSHGTINTKEIPSG